MLPSHSDYNIRTDSFPLSSLSDAAARLKITINRLSRILRILSIPVYRQGYTIYLDDAAIARVKEALRSREIRPGRRKKERVQR